MGMDCLWGATWPYPLLAVDPKLELFLSVVYLAGGGEGFIAGKNDSDYFTHFLSRFETHRGHPAVAAYRQAIAKGFKPENMAMGLVASAGPLPDLIPREELPPELGEAREWNLFVGHLANFARDSRFSEFFEAHRPVYIRHIESFMKELETWDYAGWARQYCGMAVDADYTLLVSPLLNGASPVNHTLRGKPWHIKTVWGYKKWANGKPFLDYDFLAAVVWHELGHALLDDLTQEDSQEAQSLKPCFRNIPECRENWTECIRESAAEAFSRNLWRWAQRTGKISPDRAPVFFKKGLPHLSFFEKGLDEYEKLEAPAESLKNFYPRFLKAASACRFAAAQESPVGGALENFQEEAEKEIKDARLYYLKKREPAKALKIFEGLTRRFPQNAALWIEQAQVAYLMKQREKSMRSLQRADALGPDPEQRRDIALLHQSWGDYPQTLRRLKALIKEKPKNAVYWVDKGVCEFLNGETQEAENSLKAAIRLEPGLASSYLALGSVYVSMKRYSEAVRVYDRALAQKGLEKAEDRAALEKQRSETLILLQKAP